MKAWLHPVIVCIWLHAHGCVMSVSMLVKTIDCIAVRLGICNVLAQDWAPVIAYGQGQWGLCRLVCVAMHWPRLCCMLGSHVMFVARDGTVLIVT